MIQTDKAVKPGRQIYLDYDGYPSYYYLLQYGFNPISNIHDCLLISLPSSAPSIHNNHNQQHNALLEQVLQDLGYPGSNAMCLDITRFLNDRYLAYFLLESTSNANLRRCHEYYHQTILRRAYQQWEIEEIRRCALGQWEGEVKPAWDRVQEGLKEKLREHLIGVKQEYSTSIAEDHVSCCW